MRIVKRNPVLDLDADAKRAARTLTEFLERKGYRPKGLHTYRREDGTPLFCVIRWKLPDDAPMPEDGERKKIFPMSLTPDGFKLARPKDCPEGYPLYGLDRLAAAPDAPVWIVEGEKCADALTALKVLAVTSPFGAQSGDRVDLRPLAGREVIIWPDNDAPGRGYAEMITDRLGGIARSVEWIDLAPLDLAEGEDAADWIARHPDATALDLAALARHSPPPPKGGDDPEDGGAVEPVKTICAADVVMRPVKWLWKNYIPRGAFTMIAGRENLGKSQLLYNLAATVSTGGRWPDGSVAKRGSVIIFTREDNLMETATPRLKAAGADFTRCHFIHESGVTISEDLARIAAMLARFPDTLLVTVDPIASYLGRIDSHKQTETRQALDPLKDLAEHFGVSVTAISHFNKGKETDMLQRIAGSVAFTGAPRAVFGVIQDADDDEKKRRLFIMAKNNLAPMMPGFSFTTEGVELLTDSEVIETQRIIWGEQVTMTAREAMAAAQAEPEDRGAREDAEDFLTDALADGPVSARELDSRAEEAGIKPRTLRRAKKALGAVKLKDGMKGGWNWHLPPKMAKNPEDGHSNNEATFGEFGHLRGIGPPSDAPESTPQAPAQRPESAEEADRRIYGPGGWIGKV